MKYLELIEGWLITPIDEWTGGVSSKIRAFRGRKLRNLETNLVIEIDQLELIHDLGQRISDVINMFNPVPDGGRKLILAVIEEAT